MQEMNFDCKMSEVLPSPRGIKPPPPGQQGEDGGAGGRPPRSSSRRCRLSPSPLLASAAAAALLVLALVLGVTKAEVQDFAILLPPTDEYIHFADGYLRGPGASVDLRDLTFTAVSESGINLDNKNSSSGEEVGIDDDDDINNDDGGDDIVGGGDFDGGEGEAPAGGDGGGGGRRRLDGGVDIGGSSTIDIVSFMLPAQCANSRKGCDWTKLGVGAKLPAGSVEGQDSGTGNDALRWCCTNDAIEMGMCDGGNKYGRLIVTEDFQGMQRSVSVPNEGKMTKKLKNDFFEFEETGRYVVVFANCNDAGREVMVSGEAIWKSTHGFLPGQLFGFMYFYTALFAVYVLLFVWYGCLMRLNAASRIPIEKWVLVTIAFGLLELLARTLDYWDWNADGRQHDWLTYLGITLGVLKHGISRCLIVMVSLGWGVIRDTLGSALHRVVILGIVYVAVAGLRDFMIIFAVEDMQTMSYDEEVELFDLATILTFVVAAVDVIFIMWILDALNGTMMYLENMSQTRKLGRYLRLRTIFLFSILFATVWAVFSLVNTYDEDGIVREEHEWVVDAATELNYLFVLIGVAILWRPNPSAKEYAFVMELPAMGAGDGDGTELELTGVVPSAMDDDDDYDDRHNNGHREDDDRFKIDDAEAA